MKLTYRRVSLFDLMLYLFLVSFLYEPRIGK